MATDNADGVASKLHEYVEALRDSTSPLVLIYLLAMKVEERLARIEAAGKVPGGAGLYGPGGIFGDLAAAEAKRRGESQPAPEAGRCDERSPEPPTQAEIDALGVRSVGTCNACGYHGPGPAHPCPRARPAHQPAPAVTRAELAEALRELAYHMPLCSKGSSHETCSALKAATDLLARLDAERAP